MNDDPRKSSSEPGIDPTWLRLASIKTRLDEQQKTRNFNPARGGSLAGHRNELPAPQSVTQSIEEEGQRIRNRSLEQDIKLRKSTLFVLFGFLATETSALFAMAFFQGFEAWGFWLEEWNFRILIGATITQITIMLLVAVQYLFPKKEAR